MLEVVQPPNVAIPARATPESRSDIPPGTEPYMSKRRYFGPVALALASTEGPTTAELPKGRRVQRPTLTSGGLYAAVTPDTAGYARHRSPTRLWRARSRPPCGLNSESILPITF